MQMQQRSVRLPVEDWQALDAEKQRVGVPVNEQLRRLVAAWRGARDVPHAVGTEPPTPENDPVGRFRPPRLSVQDEARESLQAPRAGDTVEGQDDADASVPIWDRARRQRMRTALGGAPAEEPDGE